MYRRHKNQYTYDGIQPQGDEMYKFNWIDLYYYLSAIRRVSTS